MRLALLVRRKGVDPAAETCLHALRELMQAPVSEVERGTLWRFDIGAPGEEAGELKAALFRAACRAGRYVNLNRDAGVWLDEGRPGSPRARRGECAADVWVRDGDGRDAAALAYFRQRVTPRLADLGCGILYRLWLREPDPEAARRLALQLAVTRSRRAGLLANPHYQTVEVLEIVPPAPLSSPTEA